MGKTAIAIRAFVALCVLSSSTLASWQPADIEGRWLGTIDTSLAYVPVLLKMTRTADGYSATLNATRLRAVLVKGDWSSSI